MATFAEIITALREETGKKRQETADALGISRASLEYYEKGKRKPDIEILAKFADYYDVTADYLIGRTTAKTTDKDLRFVCDYTGLSEISIKGLHSEWGMTVNDIIDYLMGTTNYHEFWDFCAQLRLYRIQYKEMLDWQDNIMKDSSITPSSYDELKKIIRDYNTLQDNKDLSEFKLQKLLHNLIVSYCEAEVNRENKNKVEFQNTYNYLMIDLAEEYLSSKERENNAHNPKA